MLSNSAIIKEWASRRDSMKVAPVLRVEINDQPDSSDPLNQFISVRAWCGDIKRFGTRETVDGAFVLAGQFLREIYSEREALR